MTEVTVESPCISVCAMNEDTGFCIGCYRTLEEIKSWWDLENTEKKAVVEAAKQREEDQF